MPTPNAADAWPELPYAAWTDTYETLHLWTQIVGKVRLVLTPWLNHSWHVTLYVTTPGLNRTDARRARPRNRVRLHRAVLWLRLSDGEVRQIVLRPITVAEFYAEVMHTLSEVGVAVRIHEMPSEIPDAVRFSADRTHASYDRDYANRHSACSPRRIGCSPISAPASSARRARYISSGAASISR